MFWVILEITATIAVIALCIMNVALAINFISSLLKDIKDDHKDPRE